MRVQECRKLLLSPRTFYFNGLYCAALSWDGGRDAWSEACRTWAFGKLSGRRSSRELSVPSVPSCKEYQNFVGSRHGKWTICSNKLYNPSSCRPCRQYVPEWRVLLILQHKGRAGIQSKMEASLLSLTSELHEAIASHLELEDLLMMGSTCQHFRKLVSASESEVTWTQLYDTYWGTTAYPHGISARAAFKMRWEGNLQ